MFWLKDVEIILILLNTFLILVVFLILNYRFKKISFVINKIFDNRNLKKQESILKCIVYIITILYYVLSVIFIMLVF